MQDRNYGIAREPIEPTRDKRKKSRDKTRGKANKLDRVALLIADPSPSTLKLVMHLYALRDLNLLKSCNIVCLADLGKARGCSTNSFVIPTALQLYGATTSKRLEIDIPVIK